MTPTQHPQAAVNVMQYRQTATATAFPIEGTREVVVQTVDVAKARGVVEGWHG